MDQSQYGEFSVKVKKQSWVGLTNLGLTLALIFGMYLTAMEALGGYAFMIPVIVVLTWFFTRSYTKLEFEYIFLTDELHIDKIYSGERRKKGITIQMGEVESVGPTNPNTLGELKKKPNSVFKDYSSQKKGVLTYTIMAYKDGKPTCILFEPDDHILKLMKHAIPNKVRIAEIRKDLAD